MSHDILLTGSVGLESAEEVFRTLGRALGTRAPRLPDGETGYARSVWIQSQAPASKITAMVCGREDCGCSTARARWWKA